MSRSSVPTRLSSFSVSWPPLYFRSFWSLGGGDGVQSSAGDAIGYL